MLGVVRLKEGVRLSRIQGNPKPAGFRILAALDMLAARRKADIFITSGDENPARLPNDPHSTGEAYDISIRGWEEEDIIQSWRFLVGQLGSLFSVLYEIPKLDAAPTHRLQEIAYINPKATAPHFHIQRKKGTVYPPPSLRV